MHMIRCGLNSFVFDFRRMKGGTSAGLNPVWLGFSHPIHEPFEIPLPSQIHTHEKEKSLEIKFLKGTLYDILPAIEVRKAENQNQNFAPRYLGGVQVTQTPPPRLSNCQPPISLPLFPVSDICLVNLHNPRCQVHQGNSNYGPRSLSPDSTIPDLIPDGWMSMQSEFLSQQQFWSAARYDYARHFVWGKYPVSLTYERSSIEPCEFGMTPKMHAGREPGSESHSKPYDTIELDHGSLIIYPCRE